MGKTIEQQIADGIAQGIQQAKDIESTNKSRDFIGGVLSIVCSVIVIAFVASVFGENKYINFIAGAISIIAFQYFFNRQNFKKHLILNILAGIGWGFLFMLLV